MSEPKKDKEAKLEVKSEVKEASTRKSKPVRSFFKSFVDVKRWSSYDEVSAHTKTTVGLFRRLFSRSIKEVRHETYEEAIARLGLTPEQVIAKKKSLLQQAIIYGIFTLAFFVYFFYLLINIKLVAAGMMLILVVLMALSTYQEHFWYMQMHKKKLGCNFAEWLDFVLWRKAR